LEKSYLRKLRIAMNPKNGPGKRKIARESIRKSMRMMLEAEKLETELFMNPRKMKPKDKILLEKRFDQVMKEREKEKKDQMRRNAIENKEDAEDDFRCPPCS
jgi:hypothetical protein